MQLNDLNIINYLKQIRENNYFIELENCCNKKDYHLEMGFQLAKPIKKNIAVWLYVGIYNKQNELMFYDDRSGEGKYSLLMDIVIGFYDLKKHKFECVANDFEFNSIFKSLKSDFNYII